LSLLPGACRSLWPTEQATSLRALDLKRRARVGACSDRFRLGAASQLSSSNVSLCSKLTVGDRWQVTGPLRQWTLAAAQRPSYRRIHLLVCKMGSARAPL